MKLGLKVRPLLTEKDVFMEALKGIAVDVTPEPVNPPVGTVTDTKCGNCGRWMVIDTPRGGRACPVCFIGS